MGSTNAYACDGPQCGELTTRDKGERYPRAWIRVTVQPPEGGESVSASVHDRACLDRWLDEQVGAVPSVNVPDRGAGSTLREVN